MRLFIFLSLIFLISCSDNGTVSKKKKELTDDELIQLRKESGIIRKTTYMLIEKNNFGIIKVDSVVKLDESYNSEGQIITSICRNYNKRTKKFSSIYYKEYQHGILKYNLDSLIWKDDYAKVNDFEYGPISIEIRKSLFDDKGRLLNYTTFYDSKVGISEKFKWLSDTVSLFYSYDRLGKLNGFSKSCYNKRGQEVLRQSFDVNNTNLITFQLSSKYDSFGNCIEQIGYEIPSESIFPGLKKSDTNRKLEIYYRQVWEYDNKGNLTKSVNYASDGSIEKKTEKKYSYDKLGNLTHVKNLNDDEESFFKYDNFGNKIEAVYVSTNGQDKTVNKMKYDNAGNLLEEIEYENEIRKSIERNVYDREGNKIKEEFLDGDKNIKRSLIYSYNNLGLVSSFTDLDNEAGVEIKTITIYKFNIK